MCTRNNRRNKKEISSFINVKEDFRNKNWSNYINEEVEVLPLM